MIYNENCLDTMSRMPSDYIDLVVTSPPYDDIRTYNNPNLHNDFNFPEIAKALYRIIKPGGIVVWIVGDKVKDGNESCTSFKQALYFREIGFNLYDTMIWEKNRRPIGSNKAYYNIFDYMFVFAKGVPTTVNLICDTPTRSKRKRGTCARDRDGNMLSTNKLRPRSIRGRRGNIWHYHQYIRGQTTDADIVSEHPATFPEKLAEDHIKSWSNIDDIVYDPFAGSGTVLKMAYLNGRKYLGSEINPDYCKIIHQRLQRYLQ